MKKLFLASSFKDVAHRFTEFAGNNPAGKRVTFIPTAALHEKVNFYVKAGRKALENIGLIVDVLEISTAILSDITGKLEKNDFIYATGGNTFFLLQELLKSGADKIISEQIYIGKPYIGESAGSMVLAPNIEYVKYMDSPKAAPELKSCHALNIVDFFPVPHQGYFPFKKAVDKIIAEYGNQLPLSVISNTQAIIIDGDKTAIKG